MKKYLILILTLISFSVFAQQAYNKLTVKDLTVTNNTVLKTTLNGIAKLSSGVLTASSLINGDISAVAGIDYSKLATLSTGQMLVGNAGVPTATTISGGFTIGATGVATLGNSAVITQFLTGYSSTTGTISSSDTIISAIQKLDGNKIERSVVTAKGTLIAGSGVSTPNSLAVGNNFDVLEVNSSTTTGLQWNQPAKSDLSMLVQFTGKENIATWSTGNNATVMGGGTISGALITDSTNTTVSKNSYRYTQAAGSLNDYFCSPTFSIPSQSKFNNGSMQFLSFPYSYDGASGDIQAVVWDVTNSAIVSSTTVSDVIGTNGAIQTSVYASPLPSTMISGRICFRTRVANSGKILRYGDLSLSADMPPAIQIQTDILYSAQVSSTGVVSNFNKAGWLTGPCVVTATAQFDCPVLSGLVSQKLNCVAGRADSNFNARLPGYDYVNSTKDNLIFRTSDSTSGGASAGPFTLNCVKSGSDYTSSLNSAVAMPTQQISSDTLPFSFKSTAINCATDPVGTYNTLTYAINSNTLTVGGTAPTQTSSSMNANGIQIFGRPFNAASTTASPSVVDVCIGSGLKNYQVDGYSSTAKTSSFPFNMVILSTLAAGGTNTFYNQTTGVLRIDAGRNQLGTETSRYVDTYAQVTNGYFVFNASTTPSISAIPVLNRRIAYIKDVKATSTDGGSSAAVTVQARNLNTLKDAWSIIRNPSSFTGTGGTNTGFDLDPGTYKISVSAPVFFSSESKLKLRNVSTSTNTAIGQTCYSTSNTAQVFCNLVDEVVITNPTTFRIDHYTAVARSGNGLGAAAGNGDVEVYTTVEVEKLK